MSLISATSQRLAGREDGFTLIELLVAILCGVVVTGALFAILEISLHQTSRTTDRVQATRSGRIAMTNVVEKLHSACLAREFAPVQAKSTATSLLFTAGFGERAVLESKEVFRHKIVWTGTYPGAGKLVDYTYPATSGTWPNSFVFSAAATPASGVTLAENIYQQSKTIPIFQYYKYATTASTGGAETPTSTLTPVEPPKEGFNATEAKGLAGVQVGYSAAPSNNNTTLGRTASFKTLVTLAFSAPSSEATIVDGPCQ